MKKPTDIHAQGSLTPIIAPPLFLRWGMDFTGPVKHGRFLSYLCTAIEYATSVGIALLVKSTDTSGVIALFNLISISFGPPKELILDNGITFVSVELKNYLINYGTSLHPTKPYRLMANGKVEKFNSILKQFFLSVGDHPDYTKQSYSPYFLAFGPTSDENYIREPTEEEDKSNATNLVRISHSERDQARQNVRSGKAGRDELCAYFAESKTRHRVHGQVDWMLKQRQREHKHEPYYDGPFCVSEAGPDGSDTLRTPGGVILKNSYHRQQLFPSYVLDGHLVRSL
ncbi:hypothetical protein K3495_g12612 [Podosphaera aphanis]|nr:hypothetical protein K3495_g12612 [Podosphaera aphanis]